MNINTNVNNTIANSTATNGLKTNAVTGIDKGTSFLDTLKEKLDDVNNKQVASDDITQKFIKGDETDVQKVMLTTSEAKLSLETAVQIRNKLVDAYNSFNSMQI
ncbi:flagellar hook-basal body complex protein FliE [Clostridium psychrophilum]|uniref:flagellar hook-basal body complex protein FliE n=1 Tax=Clostridium psychrophilum TaxID=132926 RepID=UPI001C0AE52C|nr:flagellar hook-basal body complex protein FliE [Clostridium psychrophilum]MBU3180646.1 flagellar hook-basal body complex protein FliE [Clostridium psychrophilum]